MDECLNAGFTLIECSNAATAGRAAGWVVPVVLLLGVFVLSWQEGKGKS